MVPLEIGGSISEDQKCLRYRELLHPTFQLKGGPKLDRIINLNKGSCILHVIYIRFDGGIYWLLFLLASSSKI